MKNSPCHLVSLFTMHPATRLAYDDLIAGLEQALKRGSVLKREKDGLVLYNYTQKCAARKDWDPFTCVARGLVVSPSERAVVAYPFAKFFNFSEVDQPPPLETAAADLAVSEKMDGSLGIIFAHRSTWHVITRGSWDSDQAKWAKQWLLRNGILGKLHAGTTYMAEIIYPENRVVIDYGADYAKLVLLGAYDARGAECTGDLAALGTGLEVAARHAFATLADVQRAAQALPANREGFVVRFADGGRLKFKGPAYLAAHKALAGPTPLAIWTKMRDAEDMVAYRDTLPEELYVEYDAAVAGFARLFVETAALLRAAAVPFADLSNKDIAGLALSDDEKARLFLARKPDFDAKAAVAGPIRKAVFNMFRPK